MRGKEPYILRLKIALPVSLPLSTISKGRPMFLMLSPGRAFSEREFYCLCNENKNVCHLLPLRDSTAISETLVLTCGNGCPQMMAAPDN